ncbi:DUF885 family protein [Thermodesulfobacteriota bacterium]
MQKRSPLSLESICDEMFDDLARTFPVACASDEFYYFPQVRASEHDWRTWDCFSEEMIKEVSQRLTGWEGDLDRIKQDPADLNSLIDAALLQKVARTLREQLIEVRVWQSQPTFYLTLCCIGLAEAMTAEDPEAKHLRAGDVSGFLDEAAGNLKRVPLLFRDAGLEMISDTRGYLAVLAEKIPEIGPVFDALDRFREALLSVSTREDFLLPRDLLEHIFRYHISCGMEIKEINDLLDQEIQEMGAVLNREAGCLDANLSPKGQNFSRLWPRVLENIPLPDRGHGGMVERYRDEVKRLADHCVEQVWISPEHVFSCPAHVAPMPAFLSAIRAASSYSIPPGHPPYGGVFYILQNFDMTGENNREYRMLSAHETYPGHHLLDTSRWSHERRCRREVEQPIFYEGWACFAEELLRQTGYFKGPGDRFLLAKRRLWRALRGKVDIALQTGVMDIQGAAKYLNESGIGKDRAAASARRYPLNPGYQQCYTIGLRTFLKLFDGYGRENVRDFVHVVLNQGEIDFENLEKVLKTADS